MAGLGSHVLGNWRHVQVVSDEQFLTFPFLPARFHLFSHQLKFFWGGPPGPFRTPGPRGTCPGYPLSRWASLPATDLLYCTACCRPIANQDSGVWVLSLSLRPKSETKQINFGLSPELRLTNHCSAHAHCIMSSLIYELAKMWITFVYQNLIYLLHANSTRELISFGFSDRSVRSLVSANHWAIRWDQTKKNDLYLAYLWSQSEFRTQR